MYVCMYVSVCVCIGVCVSVCVCVRVNMCACELRHPHPCMPVPVRLSNPEEEAALLHLSLLSLLTFKAFSSSLPSSLPREFPARQFLVMTVYKEETFMYVFASMAQSWKRVCRPSKALRYIRSGIMVYKCVDSSIPVAGVR